MVAIQTKAHEFKEAQAAKALVNAEGEIFESTQRIKAGSLKELTPLYSFYSLLVAGNTKELQVQGYKGRNFKIERRPERGKFLFSILKELD